MAKAKLSGGGSGGGNDEHPQKVKIPLFRPSGERDFYVN
jgi:hypothetical protein